MKGKKLVIALLLSLIVCLVIIPTCAFADSDVPAATQPEAAPAADPAADTGAPTGGDTGGGTPGNTGDAATGGNTDGTQTTPPSDVGNSGVGDGTAAATDKDTTAGGTDTTEETDKKDTTDKKDETDADADTDEDTDADADKDTSDETKTTTDTNSGTVDNTQLAPRTYTLTFKNGDKQYHVNGDTTTDATNIFTALDINPDSVEQLESSNGELFSFGKDADGKWQLVSKQPFESSEYVRVKLNGSDDWITIDVTDPSNTFTADIGSGSITITDASPGADGTTFTITYNNGQTEKLGNNATVTINGNNTATNNTIYVKLTSANHNIKLVLNAVNMAGYSTTFEEITVDVANSSNVTLEFAGTNNLINYETNGGVIRKEGNGTLTIQCAEGGVLNLTNKKDGNFVIGSDINSSNTSNIIIQNAKINISRDMPAFGSSDQVITGTQNNGVKILGDTTITVNENEDYSTVYWLIDQTNNNYTQSGGTFTITAKSLDSVDVDLSKGNVTIEENSANNYITVKYYGDDGSNPKIVKLNNNGKVTVNQTNNTTANTIKTTLNKSGTKVNVVMNGVTISSGNSPVEAILNTNTTMNLTFTGVNKLTTTGTNPVIYKHANGSNTGTGTLNIMSAKNDQGEITGSLIAEQTNTSNTSDAIGGDGKGTIVIDDAHVTIVKKSTGGNAVNGNTKINGNSVIAVDKNHTINKARFNTGASDVLVSVDLSSDHDVYYYFIGEKEFVKNYFGTLGTGTTLNIITFPDSVLEGIPEGTTVTNSLVNEIRVNDTFIPNGKTYTVGATPKEQGSLDVNITYGNVEITDDSSTLIVTYYVTVGNDAVKKYALVSNEGSVVVDGDSKETANTIKTTLKNNESGVYVYLRNVVIKSDNSPIEAILASGTWMDLLHVNTNKLTTSSEDAPVIHKHDGDGWLYIVGMGENFEFMGSLTVEQTNENNTSDAIGGKTGDTVKSIGIYCADLTIIKASATGNAINNDASNAIAYSVITVDKDHPIDETLFTQYTETGTGEMLVSVNAKKDNVEFIKYIIGEIGFINDNLPDDGGKDKENPIIVKKLYGGETVVTELPEDKYVKNNTGNEIRVNDTFIPDSKTYKVGATPTVQNSLGVDITYGNVEITDIDGYTLTVTYYVYDADSDTEANVKKYALVSSNGTINVSGKTDKNAIKTTLDNGADMNLVLSGVNMSNSAATGTNDNLIDVNAGSGSTVTMSLLGESTLTQTDGDKAAIHKTGDGKLVIKNGETGDKTTGKLTVDQTQGNAAVIGGESSDNTVGTIEIDDAYITVKKASTGGNVIGTASGTDTSTTITGSSVITVDKAHSIDTARFVTTDGEIVVSVKDNKGNTRYIIGDVEFVNNNLPTNGGKDKETPIVIEKLNRGTLLVTELFNDKYVKNSTDNDEIIVNDTYLLNDGDVFQVGKKHDPNTQLDVDIADGNVDIDDTVAIEGNVDDYDIEIGTITVTYYETDKDNNLVKKFATLNSSGTVYVKQTNSDKETTANTITTKLATDGNNVNVVLDSVNMDNSDAASKGSLIDVDAGKDTTVTLVLKGENKLTQTDGDKAAIHKIGDGSLVIKDGEEKSSDESSDKTGTLIIEQKDGDAAAIGGEGNETTKNITLDSGFVSVVRGEDAADGGAAIGAAKDGGSDNIVIESPTSAVLPVTDKDGYTFSIDEGAGVIVTAGNYFIGPVEDIKKVISTDLDPDMTILVLPDGEIYWIPEGMSVTNGTEEDIIVNGVTVAPGETYRIPYKPASDPAAKYRVIEGKDSEWTKGSKDVLVFKLNSNALIKVLIDGVEIEFTVDEDGNVTIDAEVLAALDTGRHTIEFVFSDGRCSTHFTVK